MSDSISTHTPDALASALPATLGSTVNIRRVAEIQAQKLAEAGYVLLHPETLASDEATVERLGERLHHRRHGDGRACDHCYWDAEIVLAALADTSAQARHTAGDVPGGGEDG